jgi:hypothetical protein
MRDPVVLSTTKSSGGTGNQLLAKPSAESRRSPRVAGIGFAHGDRVLSHSKLSYHPGRPLQAKAYLSCRMKPVARAG